jgi:hypothetical protein
LAAAPSDAAQTSHEAPHAVLQQNPSAQESLAHVPLLEHG